MAIPLTLISGLTGLIGGIRGRKKQKRVYGQLLEEIERQKQEQLRKIDEDVMKKLTDIAYAKQQQLAKQGLVSSPVGVVKMQEMATSVLPAVLSAKRDVAEEAARRRGEVLTGKATKEAEASSELWKSIGSILSEPSFAKLFKTKKVNKQEIK